MANIRRMTRKRLGELLLQEALVNEEQLEIGLEEQEQTGELIGEILVRKGHVNESDIARTISTQFSFPFLSVTRYYIAPEMLSLFTLEELEKHLFIPIDRFGDVLSIVVAGLLDQEIIDEIEKKTGCAIQVYVGTVSEVKQVIKEKFVEAAGRRKEGKETAKASQAAEGAQSEGGMVVDVTAPPVSTHTSERDEEEDDEEEDDEEKDDEEELAEEEAAKKDDEVDDARDDDNVMKEIEEQFKRFQSSQVDEEETGKLDEDETSDDPDALNDD